MNEETVELTFDDIEPLQKALNEMNPSSGGLEYKGFFWDWRMAQNALEDLKERQEHLQEEE